MPKEIASDLARLALFDIILYVDDSGSMAFEQGGERIDVSLRGITSKAESLTRPLRI